MSLVSFFCVESLTRGWLLRSVLQAPKDGGKELAYPKVAQTVGSIFEVVNVFLSTSIQHIGKCYTGTFISSPLRKYA